jgi:Uma2 family endonuclease
MELIDEREGLPLTRDEYEDLVRRGVLADAKVELLYGRIVSMSPIGGPHRYSVRRLNEILMAAFKGRANIEIQSSFRTPKESEPEPDAIIVPLGDYLDAPPERAWLLVEVADTSLKKDREKARLYALAGVVEYWIVNLNDEVIEVYREPRGESFAKLTTHGRGEVIRLAAFEDVAIAVSDVLPPPR